MKSYHTLVTYGGLDGDFGDLGEEEVNDVDMRGTFPSSKMSS